MKWMIASDLHGSAESARLLFEAFDREGADRILFLGDLLYHGPRNDLPSAYAPKEVIEILNSRRDQIFALRGNCDTEVDQMVLKFPILADYVLIPLGEKTIFATHGHVFHKDNLPPLKKGDVLLHGHTHIPTNSIADGIFVLNPGSATIPKNGSEKGYMILEGEKFIWKTLKGEEYDSLSL